MEYPAIPKVPYLISYTRLSVEARDGSQLGNIEAQHKTNTSIPTDLPIIHLSDYGGHRSGRSTNHRPAYRYSLRLVEDDANCRGLIVYMQDRLARDVVDTGLFVKICERLGKNLVVPLEGIDTFRTGWTTDTKMLIHIKAAFAEAYSSGVGDRIRNKVDNLREHLVPWGTPPFGYVREGKSIAAVLRPNSDAPAAVRCLEAFAGGLSYGKTLEALNCDAVMFSSRAGLPCRWSLEAVRTVIGNAPFYAGFYIGRKGWDAKASTLAATSWAEYLRTIEAVRSPHIEPVIDEALAQAIFERRRKWMHTGRVNTGVIPLLTSLGFVGGKPLRKQPRPYGVFYTIPGGGFHREVEEIDAALVARLAGVQFPPEMRAQILQHVQRRTDSARAASLRAYADELRRKQAVLLDLLMADRIDRGAYDARYDEAAGELRRVEGELMAPAEAEIAMSRLADALGTLQLMTAEKRRTNLRRIFRRVDLAASGEIERLHLHDWARQAFAGLENQTTDARSVGWNYAEGGNVAHNSTLPAWVWFVAVCGLMARTVDAGRRDA